MSFRKENLTLEQSLDRKCAQTYQFFKDLKKPTVKSLRTRRTYDSGPADIKYFAAS